MSITAITKRTIRPLLTIVLLGIYSASCTSAAERKRENSPNVAKLDSVKTVVSEALNVIENFPKEEIMLQSVKVDDLQTFFTETEYRFTREQYLGEIDKVVSAQRAFNKVFEALPSLRDEANLAYDQLASLKKAYVQKQITDEEFTEYLEREMEAAQIFMFNYHKRVTRALEFNEALDTIFPQAEALRAQAIQNSTTP